MQAPRHIRPQSLADLTKLGLALRDPKLASSDFLIVGHTDALGTDKYNLRLSQKRADSVRSFLVKAFNIEARRLIAIGYGEEKLKVPNAPEADENRRVQIVNLTK